MIDYTYSCVKIPENHLVTLVDISIAYLLMGKQVMIGMWINQQRRYWLKDESRLEKLNEALTLCISAQRLGYPTGDWHLFWWTLQGQPSMLGHRVILKVLLHQHVGLPPLAFPTTGVTSRMVDFPECGVGILVVLYSTLIHAAATSKAWDDPKQQMGTWRAWIRLLFGHWALWRSVL